MPCVDSQLSLSLSLLLLVPDWPEGDAALLSISPKLKMLNITPIPHPILKAHSAAVHIVSDPMMPVSLSKKHTNNVIPHIPIPIPRTEHVNSRKTRSIKMAMPIMKSHLTTARKLPSKEKMLASGRGESSIGMKRCLIPERNYRILRQARDTHFFTCEACFSVTASVLGSLPSGRYFMVRASMPVRVWNHVHAAR